MKWHPRKQFDYSNNELLLFMLINYALMGQMLFIFTYPTCKKRMKLHVQQNTECTWKHIIFQCVIYIILDLDNNVHLYWAAKNKECCYWLQSRDIWRQHYQRQINDLDGATNYLAVWCRYWSTFINSSRNTMSARCASGKGTYLT